MTVRVAILSVDHPHANAYANCLNSLGGAELIGVTETGKRVAEGREKAEEYGTDYYENPDALLAEADGAIVCSANATHRAWVERAAEAGADVLCEKPLAPTVEEAQAIVDSCDEADVHLGVALPLRFSQPVRNARKALENDALGDIRFFNGTNRGQMPGGWFVDPDRSGGGAVMDHTVHILDVVRWLTGEDVREVYVETGTRFHDISVEDVNLLSMQLTDGTQFTLDGSWSKPDEWLTWGDAILRLVGTDGVLEVDCFGQTIEQTRDRSDDPGVRNLFWGTNPNAGLVQDFVEAVRDDRPPLKTGAHAVHDVAVIQAAYRAAEWGESISLDDVKVGRAEQVS